MSTRQHSARTAYASCCIGHVERLLSRLRKYGIWISRKVLAYMDYIVPLRRARSSPAGWSCTPSAGCMSAGAETQHGGQARSLVL